MCHSLGLAWAVPLARPMMYNGIHWFAFPGCTPWCHCLSHLTWRSPNSLLKSVAQRNTSYLAEHPLKRHRSKTT
ncbi:hypothetical protein BGY98DRAFT_988892 [Russula aff. rugulosa BPL654]|nr:hypothetical protein BGY98DRAFT_988892 [Russula aff. rugulosa BPL654]